MESTSLKVALETLLASVGIVIANSIVILLALFDVVKLGLSAFLGVSKKKKKQPQPRTVLITGASSGIGKELALKYAKQGTVVIITGRNADRLNEVAQLVKAKGADDVIAKLVDVANEAEMEKFMLEMDAKFKLDLVVANAGVSSGIIGFKGLETNTKQLNKINVDGVYNTVLPIIGNFKERKSGQIVVVASLSALYDFPRALSYSAGKSALLVYFRGLRQVLSAYDVKVNTIVPGFVETAFTAHTRARGGPVPFLLQSNAAIDIIYEGLQNNDGVIAFPLPLYLAVIILHSLPPQFQAYINNVVAPKVVSWQHLG